MNVAEMIVDDWDDFAPEEAAGEAARMLLTFQVAGDSYALPVDLVREILENGTVTRVPMTPSRFRGVLNLRGSVVPVIDLACRLERPETEVTRRTCIIILAVPDAEGPVDMGVMVEQVDAVIDVAEASIEPAPAFGNNVAPAFIDGIVKIDDRFVVILDPRTTFDPAALAVGAAAGRTP